MEEQILKFGKAVIKPHIGTGFRGYTDKAHYEHYVTSMSFEQGLHEYKSGIEDYTNFVLLNVIPALTADVDYLKIALDSVEVYVSIEKFVNDYLSKLGAPKIQHYTTLREWVNHIGTLSNNWYDALIRIHIINPIVLQILTNLDYYRCECNFNNKTNNSVGDFKQWLLHVPQDISVDVIDHITVDTAVELYNKSKNNK